MKFSALNKGTSNNSAISSTPSSKKDRPPTQEAQESICLKLYHRAMKLQQEGKLKEAKALYCEILESEVMEGASGCDETPPSSSTILRLKFLIFKNIASIASKQGDLSAAVDAYIEVILLKATCVDVSDITVWCQLASLASSLGNLLLARKSLEQALKCHSDYWPAIESLSTVLYALGDNKACLQVVSKGLQLDTSFPRGLVYLHQIFKDDPEVVLEVAVEFPQLRMNLMTPQPSERSKFLEEADFMSKRREALNCVIAVRDPILPPKKLANLTIVSLANCLISLYKHCKDISNGSFTVPVDLSSFIDVHPTMSCTTAPHKPHPQTGKGSTSLEMNGEVPAGGSPVLSSVEGAVKGGSSGEEGKGSGGGSGKREAKRKLLDGLELFAPKRRSTRMMTRRKDNKDHVNYFEMLSKFIPSWLVMKELPELSELSPLMKPSQPLEHENIYERKCQLSALIDSTPCLLEAEVVRMYVEDLGSNAGVIHVLYHFIKLLSLHYDHKWSNADSSTLGRAFVDIYEHIHHHLCFPSPLCTPIEAQEEGFSHVAMVALCFVEMYLDTYKGRKRPQGQVTDTPSGGTSSIKSRKSFTECLAFAHRCSGLVGKSPLDKVKYTIRLQWSQAKYCQSSNNNDGAIQALIMCRDLLQVFMPMDEGRKNLMIYLPNYNHDGVISLDHVTEKIKELEQSTSLKHIKDMFDRKDYFKVIHKLQSFIESDITMPSEFLIGAKGQSVEVTSLSLLLDSLFQVQSYYSCLQTSVQGCFHLLQNYQLGSGLWTGAMRDTFRVIDSCLSSDEGLEQLRERQDVRLLKRLVVCVLKTMDLVYDMTDTDQFLSMPVGLLWKVLYIVISSDWQIQMEEDSVQIPTATTTGDDLTLTVINAVPKDDTLQDVISQEIPCAPRDVEGEKEAVFHVPSPPSSPDLLSIITSADSSPDPEFQAGYRGGGGGGREGLSLPLQFLCMAHDHLGKMGWCCKDSGSFLIKSVTSLRSELQLLTRHPPKERDMLLQELEQCYYCLYGHPTKKAKMRGLVDHCAEQVPLKWESALMLIEHYRPLSLPSIDDAKSPQVTAEIILLYKRILNVLPDYGKVLSKYVLEKFIDGEDEVLQNLVTPHQHSSVMSDIYYILADDALKSMDNHKAIRYYMENLSYCPNQFDSWAGLALGRSRIILEKLNQRNFKTGMEKYICKHSGGTVVCFKKAASLNVKHCYIMEKFGFFCYAVQSFASQILHQSNLFVLSGVHPWASRSHREMLKLAETCFTQALGLEGTKHAEPWIYHWMLGKISFKLDLPMKYVMTNFIKSAKILHRDEAGYPNLVELSSKNHAIEAIEVHYQLHSTPLKYLLHHHISSSSSSSKVERKEREDQEDDEASIQKALLQLKDLPLSQSSYPILWEWAREIFKEALTHLSKEKVSSPERTLMGGLSYQSGEEMDVDVICSQDSVVKGSHDVGCVRIPQGGKTLSPSSSNYMQLCFYGVAVCAVRCPAYYKPLYRLATTLLALGLPHHSREILLGPLPSSLLQCQEKLQPLFVLKSNIFTNMWQVPTEEINRPGSFSSHTRRHLELLLLVLVELKEADILLTLAQCLKVKPDITKQYLRDNERVAIHKKIIKLCIQVLVNLSQKQENMNITEADKYRHTATAIRTMATKLDGHLIKELDSSISYFQMLISAHKSEPTLTTSSLTDHVTLPQLT